MSVSNCKQSEQFAQQDDKVGFFSDIHGKKKIMNLTGYSTALFSTWYLIEEFGVLFDAGDGVVAHLLQKAMKAKYVFISHADRDHLTGLSQFVQLNSRDGFPKIYYPKDCGSFRQEVNG
jgi:ribonuclease BN (tRNA processing enzyme)